MGRWAQGMLLSCCTSHLSPSPAPIRVLGVPGPCPCQVKIGRGYGIQSSRAWMSCLHELLLMCLWASTGERHSWVWVLTKGLFLWNRARRRLLRTSVELQEAAPWKRGGRLVPWKDKLIPYSCFPLGIEKTPGFLFIKFPFKSQVQLLIWKMEYDIKFNIMPVFVWCWQTKSMI